MAYEVTAPFWQFVDHWQTLITGFVAVLAAIGTVWVTINSAKREISAAQDQIAAAQRMEQHRIARESYAFLAMLAAAMGTVLDDIKEARAKFANEPAGGYSPMAYAVRQQIKKTAFTDLRSACIRLGGQLTAPLLRLDNDIDVFAAQWINMPGTTPIPIPTGANAGLLDHLERIESQAVYLRDEATDGMKRWIARIQETQDPDNRAAIGA